ncbi:MAG: hypothetical protein EOL97_09855 [Spirochaetia bacterium]|nr:hypothetical protein [Spirochaetia bacterium]
MKEETEKEILDLYFNKYLAYSDLMKHYNNKYTYAEIKKVIRDRYKNYSGIDLVEKKGGVLCSGLGS